MSRWSKCICIKDVDIFSIHKPYVFYKYKKGPVVQSDKKNFFMLFSKESGENLRDFDEQEFNCHFIDTEDIKKIRKYKLKKIKNAS